MKKILERYPLFLLLLPLFVTIHLEKEFRSLIDYRFVYDRIIIFLSVPLLLFFLLRWLIRSGNKAALISLVISFFFFYTGELKNWLEFKVPGTGLHRYSFLIPATTVIAAFLIFLIKRSVRSFRFHFLMINTALSLFIIADLLLILSKQQNKIYTLEDDEVNSSLVSDSSIKPDIYYLLFDNYSSSLSLEADFNYSNKSIEEYLKQKGFYILQNARSNYSYTAYSMGSILNMNYIKNIDTANHLTDRKYLQAMELVYDNKVIRYLKKEGYQVYNHSLFTLKSHPSSITDFDNWGFRETFDQYNLVLKLNQDLGHALPVWLKKITGKNKYFINDPQNRIALDLQVEKDLLETTRLRSNNQKFVYAHFLRMHPPFYTDSSGNLFKKETALKEAYIHQVVYCNNMMKRITDSIFANTQKPVVIIIQSDHGYNADGDRDIRKHLSSFNAVYYFNRNYDLYTDSVSNVNTFRILFNSLFEKNYTMLENRSYLFK